MKWRLKLRPMLVCSSVVTRLHLIWNFNPLGPPSLDVGLLKLSCCFFEGDGWLNLNLDTADFSLITTQLTATVVQEYGSHILNILGCPHEDYVDFRSYRPWCEDQLGQAMTWRSPMSTSKSISKRLHWTLKLFYKFSLGQCATTSSLTVVLQ